MAKHFLFENLATEEYFLVYGRDLEEAIEVATENGFTNIEYICEYSNAEAEMSGLDEY